MKYLKCDVFPDLFRVTKIISGEAWAIAILLGPDSMSFCELGGQKKLRLKTRGLTGWEFITNRNELKRCLILDKT